MLLKIKKLHENAIIPTYATKEAACFDLHACFEGGKQSFLLINKDTAAVIRTGLSFEIPHGHTMLIFSRSGHGFNKNVRLSNCVGVIDADYRGEVKVKLTRDEVDGGEMFVHHGDRIAQAMLIPVSQALFMEVQELTDTARGAGGFGSTGA